MQATNGLLFRGARSGLPGGMIIPCLFGGLARRGNSPSRWENDSGLKAAHGEYRRAKISLHEAAHVGVALLGVYCSSI